MTKNTIELLDTVKHRNIKINTLLVDVPENQINTAYVTVGELSTLVHEYAIFITKNPNTGQFLMNALLGIESAENLYIQKNVWQARYLPLEILRRPFHAILSEEGDFSGGRIALDVANPLVQKELGEKIFDEKGQATGYLQRIQNTFAQLMAGTQQTNKILEALSKYDLLEPITLELDLGAEFPSKMNGLYTINKDNLAKLSGEALEDCHQKGLLQVCHLIMSSGAHVEKLVRWSKEKHL
ncbi:SapC family protein [Colwellia sp. RE-S-Sl-9]